MLHSFSGGADGALPYGNLIVDGGVLYGTTSQGGAANVGTVFKITTGGVENVVRAFGVAPDGAYPFGALINVSGTYYGTTESGRLARFRDRFLRNERWQRNGAP